MSLFFGNAARDRGQTPVLVRLVELGRIDACALETRTNHFQLSLIANSDVDV